MFLFSESPLREKLCAPPPHTLRVLRTKFVCLPVCEVEQSNINERGGNLVSDWRRSFPDFLLHVFHVPVIPFLFCCLYRTSSP